MPKQKRPNYLLSGWSLSTIERDARDRAAKATQRCTICGCHDFDACVIADDLFGVCHWVAPSLCSACVVFLPWLAFAALAGAGMPMPPEAIAMINRAIDELQYRRMARPDRVPVAMRGFPHA